jgi:HlyD family secretion protein
MKLSKKLKNPYVIGVIIVLIVGGYYWYSKSKATSTTVSYKTAQAEKGTLTTSISGSGNVIVDNSASVDPTITGTVANLAVNVGDTVKKGQTLFTIVNDDLTVSNAQSTASLQQAQNSVDSANVNVDQAEATYKAAKKADTDSHDQKEVLKEQIDIAENGVTAAQKSYTAALASYNNQLTNSAKRTVVAPISGTVNAVNVKNGDDLSRLSSNSNSSAAIIIGDLSTLKAQVQVNEVDISNVSIGQEATMTFSGIDGLTSTGKVEKMDSLGTLTSGVVDYNVTIGFDSLDPRIRPEMSVSAAIITGVKQDVILVPNSAVKTQNGNSYVQVLSGQTPQSVNVEVGLSDNTQTEIVSGINVGDNVVTQTINPKTTTAATTTTTTSAAGGAARGGAGGGGLRIPGLGG